MREQVTPIAADPVGATLAVPRGAKNVPNPGPSRYFAIVPPRRPGPVRIVPGAARIP